MLSINTDINSIKFLRNLNCVTSAAQKAMERMSSGYKINNASDDASGLVISKSLTAQTNGLATANNNAQMATNILSTADSSLSQMSDSIIRIRDLALQSANGTYTQQERNVLQQEVNQLSSNIDQLIQGTKFNNFKIFQSQKAQRGGGLKLLKSQQHNNSTKP